MDRIRPPGRLHTVAWVSALGAVTLLAAACQSTAAGGTAASTHETSSEAVRLSPSTQPPIPAGDVVTYRGDDARTGAMPGPAPVGKPAVSWSFEAHAPIASSPAVVGRTVYLVGNDGTVHALSLDQGIERWQTKLGATASASPLVADGLLIVGDSTGTVHALDTDDGSARWTQATDGPISGAAARIGDVAIVGTTSGTGYAIDLSTGSIRWSTPLGGSISTSVAVADGTAYVGAGRNLSAVAVSDGRIRWQEAVSASGRIGTPTAAGGLVFAATGLDADDPSVHGIVALDVSNGAARWRFESPTRAVVYTPAVVDGRAYIVGEDGRVVALDAASGALQWVAATDQVDEAVPAVANGQVFVAGNGGAMNALDASTGALRWTVPYRGVPYGPTVVDGYVLVGTNLGMLIAIGGSSK